MANRYLGPLIMLIYFIFVDLVLVSMLIAVVEDAFSRAQDDLRENKDRDKLFESFERSLFHMKGAGKVAKKWVKKSKDRMKKIARSSGKSVRIGGSTRSIGSNLSENSSAGPDLDDFGDGHKHNDGGTGGDDNKTKRGKLLKGLAIGVQANNRFSVIGNDHIGTKGDIGGDEDDYHTLQVDDDSHGLNERDLQGLMSANRRKKNRSMARINNQLRGQSVHKRNVSMQHISRFIGHHQA